MRQKGSSVQKNKEKNITHKFVAVFKGERLDFQGSSKMMVRGVDGGLADGQGDGADDGQEPKKCRIEILLKIVYVATADRNVKTIVPLATTILV